MHFMSTEGTTKHCSNPDCIVKNPEFYQGRSLCKKCFSKTIIERRINKEKYKDNIIDDQSKLIENMQKTIELLTERLSHAQIKDNDVF